jgi:hypothetical protein
MKFSMAVQRGCWDCSQDPGLAAWPLGSTGTAPRTLATGQHYSSRLQVLGNPNWLMCREWRTDMPTQATHY